MNYKKKKHSNYVIDVHESNYAHKKETSKNEFLLNVDMFKEVKL